ncbi:catenin delta-1-like [Gastrophryne carolinensis]
MDEPETDSPASILASVRAQEAQFELLSRALEEERRHVTAQLDRVWVTPQETVPTLANGTLTRRQQNGRIVHPQEGQRKKYPDITPSQDRSPVYSPIRMDSHGPPADETYPLEDDPSYLSYSMSDDPRHIEIPIKPSVGYSQTLDRPYRDGPGGGVGAYTTVPRNYHFRGPGTEPMPMIPPQQLPGYSSLSRPNQRYRTVEPYRGPGYGPQPQVRGAGFGGSQSDLLSARYASEDGYGLEEDRRSLGGYVDGPSYATTGRRGPNGTDPRRRLRSYEDQLADHYGSLPPSGSLSSLGPAPLTVAPSGPWRQPELPEVLAMLSYTLDAVRLNAAAYLQHLSYRNEEVKKEVCRLRGIPPLIGLLEDPRAPVRLAACGALKNLSYGPARENKLAIKNCDGVTSLAKLLRRRGDGREGREMAECVTGTLWNLSSLDSIKMELVDQALYTLTQDILVPFSGWQKDCIVNAEDGKSQHIEWEPALINTTGCLRNISSERSEARRKMRECEGLVDSVVHILRSEVGHGQVDSKLVENAVCLLRNLSYHIHREIPQAEKYKPQTTNTEPQNPSCFGARRGKGKKASEEAADTVDFPKRETPAQGYELLFQPEIVRLYIPLVKRSHTPAILEAAAGAIQNLCAGNWTYGQYIRAAVRQEKGLSSLADHLTDENERVVRAVCGALRNLCGDSRNRELIGKHAVNSLVSRLPSSSSQSPTISEDTTVAILSTIQEVIIDNLEVAKKLRESQGIERLVLINKGRARSDREIRAAGICLQTIWGFKELRRPLEKDGWKKSDFQVSLTGPTRPQTYDDSTLPLIDRNQKNDKRSEDIPLNDIRTEPYAHNGDNSTRHLNRSADLSELEPLKGNIRA